MKWVPKKDTLLTCGTFFNGEYMDICWLVVWNMFYFSHHIGNLIIATDFHIFQRGRYTTNQMLYCYIQSDSLGLSENGVKPPTSIRHCPCFQKHKDGQKILLTDRFFRLKLETSRRWSVWRAADLKKRSAPGDATRVNSHGYGSIAINTIFRGMNIHKSQLFWCELQGYKVLTHCHIDVEQPCFFL